VDAGVAMAPACVDTIIAEIVGAWVEFKTIGPIRLAKWVIPVVCCLVGFCIQSVLLHATTMHYVNKHIHVEPMKDVGHALLGHKKVPMQLLDLISGGALLVFVVGCLWLRDLRLWTKVFFCSAALFVWKGLLDYMTTLPDSSGWQSCQERLQPDGVQFFQELNKLPFGQFLRKFAEMEVFGIGHIWPVRYCSDMILSGHTAVMFLYLLASMDLCRRLTLLFENNTEASGKSTAFRTLLSMFVLCCVSADLYLIVINHFHYTVDVVLAVMLTLLIYTNAAMAIFTNWYVEVFEDGDEDKQRHTSDNGLIWIPEFCIPCCFFNGYYEVREMQRAAVIERQKQNGSKLQMVMEEYAQYGSTTNTSGDP
jgi:hypothetical protein